MLRSILYHPGNILLTLISITILSVSFGAHSDTNSLVRGDHLLEPYEINQEQMNAAWLEQGMVEKPNLYESHAALQELAENAFKKYWLSLVRKDQRYETFSPVVNGHWATTQSSTHYDLGFAGNTVKFRVAYSF